MFNKDKDLSKLWTTGNYDELKSVVDLPDESFFKVVEGFEDKDVVKQLLEGRVCVKVKNEMSKMYPVKFPLKECYEESDRTPVTGIRAQYLRLLLESGLDYKPHVLKLKHLSNWMRVLWSGDYDGMMGILKDLDKSGVKKILAKRESLFNRSSIFHVIIGAKSLLCHPDQFGDFRASRKKLNLNVKDDHIKVLKKLVSLGVDVNVHDIGGATPLHHCVSCECCVAKPSNEVCLKMANILIKAGADVNAQNRFGNTILLDSLLEEHFGLVDLLFKHAADPCIVDFHGNCPDDLIGKDLNLIAMFGASSCNARSKNERSKKVEVGGSLDKCEVCKSSQGIKRCTGCFMVWYCGQKCQMGGWKGHKVDCKKFRKEYQTVWIPTIEDIGACFIGNQNFSHCKKGDRPKKSHFVIKIQIDMLHAEGNLLVYNEDRSFNGFLCKNGNEKVHAELSKQIRNGGPGQVQGKGYFRAILNKEKKNPDVMEVKVNPFRLQPVENW